jgi:mono/diheme cytochrome c family protein
VKNALFLLCAIGAVTVLAAESSRTVLEGVYTPEQAIRGKDIYADKCYFCHGRALLGEGEAPALSGNRFLTEWETVSVGALFDRIRTGMPIKTPGTLSRQQSADLTAFLLYYNGFPPGQTELSTRSEMLQDIKIILPKR